MKRCTKCKETKPFSGFHPDKRNKDGLQSHCRLCCNRSRKRYSQTKEGKISHRRACKKYSQTKEGKESHQRNTQIHNDKYPEKYAARWAISNAIATGKITRPTICPSCSTEIFVEAHHPDYDKPLDIDWACSECHREIHNELILV